MNEKIVLDNGYSNTYNDIYYPRLQVNKHGEIVLATTKEGGFTTGILVGKTPESNSKVPIGKKFY